MTQLDLPQVSLSRYVDLLKRRRWQVIPASLLGLLIGGIVAFFIPRFFVATASIAYDRPPDVVDNGREDPFGAVVNSAKLTIPRAIPETIEKLGWPEALTEDAFVLSENCRAIEERLQIYDFGSSKGQSFALIRLTYKDRDGERAAAFLNRLMETWIAQRVEERMAAAKLELADANQEKSQLDTAYQTFLKDKQFLQGKYQIVPQVSLDMQRDGHNAMVAAHQQKLEGLLNKKVELERLRAQLELARKALRDLPARVPMSLETLMLAAAQTDEGKKLALEIAYDQMAVESLHPGPKRAQHERNIEYNKKKLSTLAATPDIDADGMVKNPAREAQRAIVDKLEAEVQGAAAAIPLLEAELAKQGETLERQAEGYALFEAVETKVATTRTNLDAAEARVQAALHTVGQLNNKPPVRPEARATVPPVPTDPNLLVVALLGCVIGLFAAVGLVLVLDMLRGSFKTVDDVERTLAVPVLGSVSFLETAVQRQQLARARRRATIVAAAFLMLVGGVVLLYYFDPTRLPPIVRDMLSIVLGTA
ncbi:MAG: hypothetical protein KDE27_29085 [Planctomycetes bacterium]|nr:hypothetical protein [Planctomycetota bacterium]